ncbi:MAG: FtsX-like permease family protein [Candidatus Aminicenantes bacterium]|nr:FtsX-like permease family protein [Candidatus Aminicenantes bacterium]
MKFKNYLLVALRNLKKQKFYSAVNLIGLAFGMAGFAIFALVAGVKTNADLFHKKGDRIYGVIQVLLSENKKEEIHTAFCPAPLIPALEKEFPEIEAAVRVYPAGRVTIKCRDNSFFQGGVLFVDPEFLTIFSFPMKAGYPESALSEPNAIVLSETAATKYFGDEDPIGQVLTLGREKDLKVTGVLENIPRTSSLRFDVLISMETADGLLDLDGWEKNTQGAFLLLEDGADRKQLEEKFPAFIDKYLPESRESLKRMYLFSFLDFRLKASHIQTFMATSHPAGVYIILFLGVLLLVIVSINFINLSTSRYMHRVREIGIRKVIGARRIHLIKQFLGESLLLAFLALPLAVVIYELINPILASYLGTFALLDTSSVQANSIWNYPFLWKYLLVAVVITGTLSGIYPAFYLSAFRPVQALKGSAQSGRKKRRGSKVMIVFQFAVSVLFIAFAGIMKTQTDEIMNSDFGYNWEQVAYVRLAPEARPQLELLKEEISRHPEIVSVSASAELPLVWSSPKSVRPTEASEEDAVKMEAYGVDYEFIETFQMEIIRGRSHQKARGDSRNFVINETAAQKLPWDNPIGKSIIVGDRQGTIIGVARDFLFADIGFKIPPAVLCVESENLNFLLVKYDSRSRFEDVSSLLNEKWQSFVPDLPFTCMTLEGYFDDLFGLVKKMGGFFNLIGLVAILFSCLGLLGLVSFMLERKTKEIGIRKVLGASTPRITWNIIKEYLLLVLIANGIALILVYFGWRQVLMTGLLFITPLNFGVYASAFMLTLMTAALAVMSRTWKAATSNPIDALRYE